MDNNKDLYVKMCDNWELQQRTLAGDMEGKVTEANSIWTEGEEGKGRCIWLPSQEEIQELMLPDYANNLDMLVDFYGSITVTQLIVFKDMFDATMDQCWLAFYMKGKHGMVWRDGRWKCHSHEDHNWVEVTTISGVKEKEFLCTKCNETEKREG